MKFNALSKICLAAFMIIALAAFLSCENDQQKFVREREAKERTIGDPIKQLAVKIGEYYDLKFPENIQDKPKLKPKFAIVHNYKATTDYSKMTIYPQFDGFHYLNSDLIELIEADPVRFSKERSLFGFSESELAQNTSEIATTIKINCGNDKYLGNSKRITRNKAGKQTGSQVEFSYETVCKVSVFDMAEKLLIAEKTFSNETLAEVKKESPTANTNNESWKIPKQLSEYISEYLSDLKKN
jgi:hypothetical protein